MIEVRISNDPHPPSQQGKHPGRGLPGLCRGPKPRNAFCRQVFSRRMCFRMMDLYPRTRYGPRKFLFSYNLLISIRLRDTPSHLVTFRSPRMRWRNSSRVFSSCRNIPFIELVIAYALWFSTPRILMHR